MTESRLTRCPGCATVFRITAEQLAFREGQVRCGHCRAVFDANDHFVSLDAAPPPDDFVPPGEEPREAVAESPGAEASRQERIEEDTPRDDARAPEAAADAPLTEEAAEEALPAKALAYDETGGSESGQYTGLRGEEALTDGSSIVDSAAEAVAALEAPDSASEISEIPARETGAREREPDAPEQESDVPEEQVAALEPQADAPEQPADAPEQPADAPEQPADALEQPADALEQQADASEQLAETPALAAANAGGIGAALGGPAERFQWKKRTLRAVPPRLYAVAAALLVAGLALQLVLEYRDRLAAYVPATRPLLAAACRPLGCTIGPLRDGAALSIDASDLQADPAHRGLLLLSATIRNRAGHAIAFPYLELTLTDASDRVVVRRAFPPAEYASGSADIAAGIPPNGEHVVRLFLDASATQQAGYRVYLLYP